MKCEKCEKTGYDEKVVRGRLEGTQDGLLKAIKKQGLEMPVWLNEVNSEQRKEAFVKKCCPHYIKRSYMNVVLDEFRKHEDKANPKDEVLFWILVHWFEVVSVFSALESMRDRILREVEQNVKRAPSAEAMLHRVLWLLHNPFNQPQHVDEKEASMMREFYGQGFSMDDVAFVVGRSSQTVHAVVRHRS